MKVFTNPTWIICVILFLIHQLSQKIMGWKIIWLDSYLDPLLSMPIFLGFVLAERRFFYKKIKRNGNYNNMYTFSIFETIIIILILTLIFEEGFPRWSSELISDNWDYLCYLIGGIIFYFKINK